MYSSHITLSEVHVFTVLLVVTFLLSTCLAMVIFLGEDQMTCKSQASPVLRGVPDHRMQPTVAREVGQVICKKLTK